MIIFLGNLPYLQVLLPASSSGPPPSPIFRSSSFFVLNVLEVKTLCILTFDFCINRSNIAVMPSAFTSALLNFKPQYNNRAGYLLGQGLFQHMRPLFAHLFIIERLSYKRVLAVKGIVGALGVLVGLIGVDLGYAKYVEYKREKRIRQAFEKGSTPTPTVDEFLPRDVLLERLKVILIPKKAAKFYNLITGEHGTGKTTLVLNACREVGVGCVYVSVPDDTRSFGKALAEAIGFQFDEYISFTEALRRKILGIEMKGQCSLN